MDKVCRDCSARFVLTDHEINFYIQKDLQLPRRCAACRRLRKAAERRHTDSQWTAPIGTLTTGRSF